MATSPITIGPFDNVPAPGSPIASAWAQEISTYVVNSPARHAVGMFSASQAIAGGGNVTISFTTETYDTDGYHAAGAPTIIVIPAGLDGIYVMTLNVTFDANVTNGIYAIIMLPGASVTRAAFSGAPGSNIAVTTVAALAAGNQVTCQAYSAGPEARNVTASFQLARISM